MTSVVQSAVLAPAPAGVQSSSGVRSRARTAFAAVVCTVAIAPFERVLIGIGGFTLTTVEASMLAALAAGFYVVATSRPAGGRMPVVVLPGLVLVAIIILASLVAPIERGNALRFAGRMAAAASMAVVVARVVDTEARAAVVIRTFLVVAVCVAAIAVLESAQVPWVMKALTVFRPGFHVVGGQLRATSTLFYPTIASMYLELAFACGLGLLYADRSGGSPWGSRDRASTIVVFVALATIATGIAATFTRAGLFGMAAALVLVGGVRIARLGFAEAAVGRLVALAAFVVTVVLALHSPELLLTRISSEGSQAWYGARYEVPVTLDLDTGRMHQVPITLTNTGRLTWDSTRQPAYAVSYHWLRAGSEAVVQFDGQRTPFAAPVSPGATVTMPVFVTAPGQPGTYTLVWDLVLESRAWLSTEGVPPARTLVRVEGEPSSVVKTTMSHLPPTIVRPGRLALWSAATGIAREHPLLGIGPDNYRHVYGRYLGLERFDARVHANDMYLEILAGAGLAGFAALVWLLGAWGLALMRRCRDVPREALMPAAAALAAWLMIAGHGLVDSFLSFTTTYLSFAIVLGLSFSRAWMPPDAAAARSARWEAELR